MMSETKLEAKEFLVPEETYMTSGIHIGTTQKNSTMKKFVYKVRNDGLYVLNINQTDERIRIVAKMLARYEPEDILVVSTRIYGKKPVSVFSKTIGTKYISERYVPGTLTNPHLKGFMEPKIIFLTDPAADSQILKEAVSIGIPVVSICDTNNDTNYIDLVIPANNKGRRALAIIYWLLAREIFMVQKKINSYDEFELTIEDFEASL